MPSAAPTHVLKMDLNGTGVLVDVTTYADDLPTGIASSWGRSNWASDQPDPGALTFTLNNADGRFMPGNTASYAVGVQAGVIVEWTCNTRVRRYRVTVPTPIFPTSRGLQSLLTVTCVDALATISAITLKSVLAESILSLLPNGYWPLSDSAPTDLTSGAADISGYTATQIVPFGDTTQIGWQNGAGAPTDGVSALTIAAGASSPTAYPTVFGLQAISLDAQGFTNGSSQRTGVSFFINYPNIFGSTSTTTNPADGPYIMLCSFGVWFLMIRVADRKLWVFNGFHAWPLGQPTYPTLQPGVTHHIAVGWAWYTSTPSIMGFTVAIDGVTYTGDTIDFVTGGGFGDPMTFLQLGVAQNVGTVAGQGLVNMFAYNFVGTLSHFCWLNAGVVTVNSGAGDPKVLPASVSGLYGVGMKGPLETSDARFARLGAFDRHPEIAYAVQGTPNGDILDYQATAGASLLSAMCDALRGDDAALESVVTAGVETVQAWLYSTQRGVTPVVTIAAEDDLDSPVQLAFDSTGIAVTATVTGRAAAATWTDNAAPARLAATSASINGAQLKTSALLALAQYRTTQGRTAKLAPSAIIIETRTATADLLATLLALRPGVLIQITIPALMAAAIGYSSTNAYVVGASEVHTVDADLFTVQLLVADTPTAIVDDGTSSPLCRVSTAGIVNDTYIGGAHLTVSLSGTSISISLGGAIPSPGTFLSADPLDYPLDLAIYDPLIPAVRERVTMTSAPAAPTGPSPWAQTLTVVRGVNGVTVAAAHPTIELWFNGLLDY